VIVLEWIAAIIGVATIVYMVYALVRPGRF